MQWRQQVRGQRLELGRTACKGCRVGKHFDEGEAATRGVLSPRCTCVANQRATQSPTGQDEASGWRQHLLLCVNLSHHPARILAERYWKHHGWDAELENDWTTPVSQPREGEMIPNKLEKQHYNILIMAGIPMVPRQGLL